MDVTPYLELQIPPRAVFDHLAARQSRVRFLVPDGQGDWSAVTWQAYADAIRRTAQFLMNAGLKSGERAAIFATNSVEWIEAALGIQAMGAVMVPIYPSSTADQAAYVVEHGDARIVFVDGAETLARVFESWSSYAKVEKIVLLDGELDPMALLHELRRKDPTVPSFASVEPRLITWSRAQSIGRWLDAESPQAFDLAMANVSLDQVGMMLYTSGTTGRPKGVPLSHRNIAVNGRDWLQCNGPLVEEGDVDILWLPMSHIFGFGEACLGNTLGFTSYLSDPASALGLLPVARPHVFMSVPRYFEKIAEIVAAETDTTRQDAKLKEVTGGNLRFCLSGGAGLKREVKELFHRAGLLIVEGYGLTEASPTLTLNRPDAFRFDSVGRPIPSVQLKLAEDGEILARGESIFSGYHKDPQATHEVFTSDGWLKTGDLGRFTDDGFLQIIGRKKEILVTASGKNIAPVNIEERFIGDPYIQHVVVYGDGEKYLTAAFWVNENALRARLDEEYSPQNVMALLTPRLEQVNAGLARYETIKKFVVIDEPLTVENGFLTPTLKIKRKKVYEAFGDRFASLYS
ncbi:MAG: AMP-dependent synthetase/ligase [Bradymonadaceae bacterium]